MADVSDFREELGIIVEVLEDGDERGVMHGLGELLLFREG
jgi:hypothetical protein